MNEISAFEYEVVYACPTHPDGCAEEGVGLFLTLFLSKAMFSRIILINSGYVFLRNRRRFGLSKRDKFKIISDLNIATKQKENIIRACESGHMSILFVSSSSDLVSAIEESHKFVNKESILIGSDDDNDPLMSEQTKDFFQAFSDYTDRNENVFVFSHDAEYLFHIET